MTYTYKVRLEKFNINSGFIPLDVISEFQHDFDNNEEAVNYGWDIWEHQVTTIRWFDAYCKTLLMKELKKLLKADIMTLEVYIHAPAEDIFLQSINMKGIDRDIILKNMEMRKRK